MLPKDYVRFRLTGEFATDVSDASGTLLLDVRNRRWSGKMLALLDIDRALLPNVYDSPVVTGRATRSGGQATGLDVGTPVVGGEGDQAAGGVGNGVVRPGVVSTTIGTYGVVFAFAGSPAGDPKGRLHTFCHAVPGAWHVMGVTQGAGLSPRWFRDNLAAAETQAALSAGVDVYDLLAAEAARARPGSDGLLFLPYLMGERTPHLDPDARGGFFGLTARHGRHDMVRAVPESVAYSLRDCLGKLRETGVAVSQVRESGGGGKSALWRQMQADVFGLDVVTLNNSEGAAYGAALLAGVGACIWPSVEAACDAGIRVAGRDRPDSGRKAAYEAYYAVFRRLYPALKDLSHELARLAASGL